MIANIAIAVCIVCIVYILYLLNEIKKIKAERNNAFTIKPEALQGGRVDLLWRDADGKPYKTGSGFPNNVRLQDTVFNKSSFTFTFATV